MTRAAAAHLSEGPLGIGGLASYFSRKPLVQLSLRNSFFVANKWQKK